MFLHAIKVNSFAGRVYVLMKSRAVHLSERPFASSACLGEGQGRQRFVSFGERTEAFELVKNNKLFNEKIN